MKLSIAVFFAAIVAATAQDARFQGLENGADRSQDKDTRLAAIKQNHERRMARLEEMIEERRRMTEDHEAGRRRLSDDEYERASRQFRNFQRKLEQMKKRTDEDHLERFEELKSLNGLRDIDFRNLKEKLESRL